MYKIQVYNWKKRVVVSKENSQSMNIILIWKVKGNKCVGMCLCIIENSSLKFKWFIEYINKHI